MNLPAPVPPAPSTVSCAKRLEIIALEGVPIVHSGDDVAAIIATAITQSGLTLEDNDILVVTSKLFSRSENRFVDLSTLDVSEEAAKVAKETEKDPRLVELILRDTRAISRKAKNILVVRHRLGFISANAGIDASNAAPESAPDGSGPWALVMPKNPDKSAELVRSTLSESSGKKIGVVVTDSFGRPFRVGTVGAAVGVAGVPAVFDQRGKKDLFGRPLESTVTAVADQIAAAADLVAGQADESRPVILVRGLTFDVTTSSAAQLLRLPVADLYV